MTIDERLAAAGLPSLPRGVWLEIDEDALAGNLAVFRELIGPGVALNAVVKADAYGHGLVPVARVFVQAGADRLCVASLDEALALRAGGIEAPILVLFPIPADGIADAARNNVQVSICDAASVMATLERANAVPGELAVEIEVETGLTRGGVRPEDLPAVMRSVRMSKTLGPTGVWTHMASPDDEAATAAQVSEFERAVGLAQDAGEHIPPRHAAATGAVLTGRVSSYEGVRIGLGLYGLLPDDLPLSERGREAAARLRPAMSVKCRTIRVQRVPAGTRVSYGGRWQAERESVIATLPIGYGDGFVRAYSPGAEALVRGHRVPLVGVVAMDAVMADVTDVPGVEVGDEFVLMGDQNGAKIVTSELARVRTTIPWEIVTNMAQRLPRVYHAASVLLGLRTLGGEARVRAVDPAKRGD